MHTPCIRHEQNMCRIDRASEETVPAHFNDENPSSVMRISKFRRNISVGTSKACLHAYIHAMSEKCAESTEVL